MWLWLVIALPVILLIGLLLNAVRDMKRLEKELPKYRDKVRRLVDDDEDDDHWLNRPTAPCQAPKKKTEANNADENSQNSGQ